MRLAAIQHRLRGSGEADAIALSEAAQAASARGAQVIVFPHVPSLHEDGGLAHRQLAVLISEVPAFCIVPSLDPSMRGTAALTALPAPVAAGAGGNGVAGLLVGDACIDPAEVARILAHDPVLAVLSLGAETDLQAEAMLEFAIALSDSLAGVIVAVGCSGAEPLEVGHGGSAIVVLGEVVAEAYADDDILLADVSEPFPQPSPREPQPPVPPLLVQRFEHNAGRLLGEHGPDLS